MSQADDTGASENTGRSDLKKVLISESRTEEISSHSFNVVVGGGTRYKGVETTENR